MTAEKTLTIDGLPVAIQDEKNILEMIRRAHIELPTFCYHSELSVYGACRLCMVEVERARPRGRLFHGPGARHEAPHPDPPGPRTPEDEHRAAAGQRQPRLPHLQQERLLPSSRVWPSVWASPRCAFMPRCPSAPWTPAPPASCGIPPSASSAATVCASVTRSRASAPSASPIAAPSPWWLRPSTRGLPRWTA